MLEMDIVDADEVTKVVPTAKDTLPWVEKYRPDSLDELIAHEEIIQILNKLIESNKLPHLLFHGPPGTGTILIKSSANPGVDKSYLALSLESRIDEPQSVVCNPAICA